MLATEKLMRNLYGDNFRKTIDSHLLDSFQQSQILEEEQIRDAFNSGMNNSVDYFIPFSKNGDESQVYFNSLIK